MYVAVSSDDNKYYRAWSTNQMQIDNTTCVNVTELPSETDEIKKQYYKLIETVTQETVQVPVLDADGNEQYQDVTYEEGNVTGQELVTEDSTIDVTTYSWELDETAYNAYVTELANAVTPLTSDERISSIEEQTASLLLTLAEKGLI